MEDLALPLGLTGALFVALVEIRRAIDEVRETRARNPRRSELSWTVEGVAATVRCFTPVFGAVLLAIGAAGAAFG